MLIRRFTPELHRQIPGQNIGMFGRAILRDERHFPDSERSNQPTNDLPLLVEKPLGIVSLYIEAGGHMQEHSADHPILFIVISGRGKLRLGGPEGETEAISAGDAILWPPHLDHMVWTEDEAIQGIAIEMLAEEVPGNTTPVK